MTLATMLLILLAALQALDAATTYVALSNGGHEANPIGRLFISFGLPGLVLAKAIATVAAWVCLRLIEPTKPRWSIGAASAACVVMALVVSNNMLVVLLQGKV